MQGSRVFWAVCLCFDCLVSFSVNGARQDLTNSEICGVPEIKPNVNLRIVGGAEAVSNSWPWQALLLVEAIEPETKRHKTNMCGASLINDQWLLSAAHCWDQAISAKGYLGLHNMNTAQPKEYIKSIKFSKIIVHPKYDPTKNYVNDIMLLKIDGPVTFNKAIKPVCIPTLSETAQSGTQCYTTGWGHTTYNGNPSDVLRQVKVPVIETSVCNQPQMYGGRVTDSKLCAGYIAGEQDACQGDSGGPLVCPTRSHWVLHGIVSVGEGCAAKNKPGVYTRVSSFYDWIQETISTNTEKPTNVDEILYDNLVEDNHYDNE